MPEGIIVKGIGGFYYVRTPEGIFECRARGLFRKKDIVPLPGDRVLFSIVDEVKKHGYIENINKRSIELVRPAVANVSQVMVVLSVNSPDIDYMLLDKLLITSEIKKANCLICINKIDLDAKNEHKKFVDTYKNSGYEVIAISAKEKQGIDSLNKHLKNNITVFAGQSGVGKSTILNRIIDEYVMETGELSVKIDRGKHTTRHAELIELSGGGYIIDTPGFSSFELVNDIECRDLEYYYRDFRKYLNSCKFTGCSHISEPTCMIKKAVEEGKIDKERYLRYIEIYKMLQKRKKY